MTKAKLVAEYDDKHVFVGLTMTYTPEDYQRAAEIAQAAGEKTRAAMHRQAAETLRRVAQMEQERDEALAASKQSDETMLAVARNLDRVSAHATDTRNQLKAQLEAAEQTLARVQQFVGARHDGISNDVRAILQGETR